MEYFGDDSDYYDCLMTLEKASDHIVKELKKVQAIKDMQKELVDALVEKTCVEKDKLNELSQKENELISALTAIGQPQDNWRLWVGSTSAVAVCGYLCYCGGRAARRCFLKSVWRAPKEVNKVLYPECSGLEQLFTGVKSGLQAIGMGFTKCFIAAPQALCRTMTC